MCPIDPGECRCIGHKIPGVKHCAPCCNSGHIDDNWAAWVRNPILTKDGETDGRRDSSD